MHFQKEGQRLQVYLITIKLLTPTLSLDSQGDLYHYIYISLFLSLSMYIIYIILLIQVMNLLISLTSLCGCPLLIAEAVVATWIWRRSGLQMPCTWPSQRHLWSFAGPPNPSERPWRRMGKFAGTWRKDGGELVLIPILRTPQMIRNGRDNRFICKAQFVSLHLPSGYRIYASHDS